MPGRATNEPTNYFALGVQSAKDVEATTFHFFKHQDGSGFQPETEIQSEREGGDGQEVGLRYKSMVKADGAVNINARPGGAGRLLAWTLGADTVASAAAGQVHTIIPAATVAYLTADQYWADNVERVSNVQMTGLSITGEAGRTVKLAGQYISGGTHYLRPAASALTATRESTDPFLFPLASVGIDGAGNSKITKFELAIKRNVDDGIQTTGYNREDVVGLNFDVDLNFTLKYESQTLYQKVQFGGGTQVALNLSTGAFNFYAAQGSKTLTLAMPVFQYVDAKVNRLDPDGKTMYIDVAAMSIKGATTSIYGVITDATTATAAYTV